MWWTVCVVLSAMWWAGLVTARTAAGLIHVLLFLCLVLVVNRMRGRA